MSRRGVEVEAMQWCDLAEVAALEAATYPDDAWSEATWWAELAGRPRRHYVVARFGAVRCAPIAGYAGIDINGENADVMTIAVAPKHQGMGLGSVLLTQIHDAAGRRGARAMLLEVRADNPAALALYARHNYAQIATRSGYYVSGSSAGDPSDSIRHEGVDAMVMRRVLHRTGESDA